MGRTNLMIFVTLAIYIAGAMLMPSTDIEQLKEQGVATQEEYTYTDSNGEDVDAETLIEVKGIGPVLTYRDIYLASIPIFVLAAIIGKIVYNSDDVIRHIMFANCVLGLLLVWLTTKDSIISTICFWLGIIAAGFIEPARSDS